MSLSNAEQFLLELINRARLDPKAEAGRYAIDLNQGLAPGKLSGDARQALAPSEALEAAATAHSLWMLATNTFSHTGVNGSQPWDRADTAGYDWASIGENIGYRGTTAASFDLETYILSHHEGLFRSAGHRENILNNGFREVGLGRETGPYTSGDTTYNSSFLTELFGRSGTNYFLTGAVYADLDADGFYSMGEGQAGASFTVGAATATSAAAGGYSLALAANASLSVTGRTAAGSAFAATVDLSDGNVKIDLVNGQTFLTSGSLTLVSGINAATGLGVGALDLTGNSAANTLTGNAGANVIRGLGGNDSINGGLGNDRIEGGDGNDRLLGHHGRDLLFGGNGTDVLRGSGGNDRLAGGAGADTLFGEAGADEFLFHKPGGADVIADFSLAAGDRLMLSDVLWGDVVQTAQQVVSTFARIDQGTVLFDFGADGSIRLTGVTTTTGLSAALDLF